MRYPFAALAEAMGLTEPRAARQLGLSGSTEWRYRRDGMTWKVADRLAVRAGLHPDVVWPGFAVPEVAPPASCPECGVGFWPTRKGHRFCSKRCSERRWAREAYRRRPEVRARKVESARRYYEECGDYVRAKQRERDRRRRAA